MTAYGEVELAVEALKLELQTSFLKPWNNEKLYASVNLAVDVSRKNRKLHQWESIQQTDQNYILESNSGAVQNILHTLDKIAPTDANVLLLGENGTGKYVLAEQIHRKSPAIKNRLYISTWEVYPKGFLKQNSLDIKRSFYRCDC